MDASLAAGAGRRTGEAVSVAAGALTLQLLPRAPYCAHDPAHASSIGVALERQTGVHAIGSDRREPFDRWPGTIAITPAGVDVFSESPVGGEYLVLRFAPGDGAIDAPESNRTRVCMAGARRAFALAREIRRVLLAPALDDALLEELAWRLAACGSAPPSGADTGRAGTGRDIDKRRYALILERIECELDQPHPIGELAAMTGQTTLAFLRGFTAAIGMTPHAYLAEQRVQAARRLLTDGRLPLTDIALACGFSHQSHFGNAFKHTFGLTPAHYRRLLATPSASSYPRS